MGPHCSQMAQPGGERRPALGDHEHRGGRKRTVSPGEGGHDPRTRPTVRQRPTEEQTREGWLADSARHQGGMSPSRETAAVDYEEYMGMQERQVVRTGVSMLMLSTEQRGKRQVPGAEQLGVSARKQDLSAKALRRRKRVCRPHLATGVPALPGLTNVEVVVGSKPSRFLSPRRRFHLRPASPMAKSAATDRKGWRASGHTCFVPSEAKICQASLLCLMCE